ncbi:hypothetical protein [uncultured Treponema sp.]|uniref:hypothetical protein n=1 Tax=uncultured Treponema sp. TaxID=162155 RepID=UPI0025E66C55|nr:hypothetical protein [uncultured Treponema sp.]
MKRNIFLLLFLLASVSFFSEDYLGSPDFIAQRGFGKSEAEAQQNALASLSRFFQMSISVVSAERTTLTDTDYHSTISEEVFLNSQTELFAVHFTKARFDRKQKVYETTAFIDREEAWKIYRPKIESDIKTFENFWSNAESQKELLLKTTGFSKSGKFAEENELEKRLDFALIVYPESESLFGNVRNNISELKPLIKRLCGTFAVQVECENDFENSAAQAAKSSFAKIGIVTTENAAEYICRIKISLNGKILPAGYFYTPSVTIEFSNGGRTILSLSEQLGKTGAKNELIAEQRTYSAIAECVLNLLNREFMSF